MSWNELTKSANKLVNKANNTASNMVANLPKNTAANMAANTAANTGSFVLPTVINNTAKNVQLAATNAMNKVNEAATNVANSVMNGNAFSGITEPIQESIQGVMENDTSIFTIPVIIMLGVLIIALIIFVLFRDQVAFGLSVVWQKIKNLFGSDSSAPPSSAVPSAPAPASPPIDTAALNNMLPGKKEVFNIAADKYTYSDAEPLCKAFGAELATYEQVKDAWNKGADWCNYGWVKGQAAVYPTQQATYDKLQAGPEDQRMTCGVPGVNGGFFDNPELRFGVNCYGPKPSENDTDKRHGMEKNLTPGALEYDRKVQNYKTEMDQIPVNPFKTGSWTA